MSNNNNNNITVSKKNSAGSHLIPMSKFPPDVQHAIKSKGGYKSAEVRRSRKNIIELNKMLDELPPSKTNDIDREVEKELIARGLAPELINDQVIVMSCARKHAKVGNVGYFNKLMDMTGEMPANKSEVTATVIASVDKAVDTTKLIMKSLGIEDDK